MVFFFLFFRLKNQRKVVVTAVDKKVPNGILEEQGKTADISSVRQTREIVACAGALMSDFLKLR